MELSSTMKIAQELMKQLSLSSLSHSNMKGGTPAKSNVMEKSLNQRLLNWNVVSNYFYIISLYTFSEGFLAMPTDVQWDFFIFFSFSL